MKKVVFLTLASCIMGLSPIGIGAAGPQNPMDCSTMSPEMQQFASQLTPANKATFCGKFTEGQRASAMQMAGSQDATGMTMTPDEAVQKVGGAGGSNPQTKTPSGCPVK